MSIEVNKSSPSCHQRGLCASDCLVGLCCGETAVSGGSQSSTFLFLAEREPGGDWMSEWDSSASPKDHSREKAGAPVLNFLFTWDKQAITHPLFPYAMAVRWT